MNILFKILQKTITYSIVFYMLFGVGYRKIKWYLKERKFKRDELLKSGFMAGTVSIYDNYPIEDGSNVCDYVTDLHDGLVFARQLEQIDERPRPPRGKTI